MSRTLVVTNDFPTRRGGIETFVLALCQQLPPTEVVVYTASMPGAAAYDAELAFPVHRDPTSMLLPTPRIAARVERVLRETGCDRVLFGASAPLGLLAGRLRQAGARRVVALTHGHEVWWARTPGARQALHRIGEDCDVLTYVSAWCRDRIAPALSTGAAARMQQLSPGVDPERFRPGCGGDEVRRVWGIPVGAPVVVCTARMVPRKGQDVLLESWPMVRARVPEARLLLVGDGRHRRALGRAAAGLGGAAARSVVFTGSVPWSRMPAHTDAGDVYAMPCRTRLAGLEPEAFGIVFLEAAACGLPVLVGGSGGAPETVVDGETGHVVPPRDAGVMADRLVELLSDPARARAMGSRGRERVVDAWTWRHAGDRLREVLEV
ncbi:MAG: glycosyltransferase family 4 protein [Marmoricola sp.]